MLTAPLFLIGHVCLRGYFEFAVCELRPKCCAARTGTLIRCQHRLAAAIRQSTYGAGSITVFSARTQHFAQKPLAIAKGDTLKGGVEVYLRDWWKNLCLNLRMCQAPTESANHAKADAASTR